MANKKYMPYATMTPEQRVAYTSDFTRWYANRQTIADAASLDRFDAATIAAFDQGVALLLAWPFGERFQESVNSLPRRLCVQRMMYLTDLAKGRIATKAPLKSPQGGMTGRHGTAAATAPAAPASATAPVPSGSPLGSSAAAPATPSVSATAPAGVNIQGRATAAPTSTLTSPAASIPTTGRLHLDQIAYLLSPALGERVRNIKTLLDTRDVESNTAKQLAQMGKPEAEIAPHSQAAVKAQEEVTAIYARVDEELAEIVGIIRYVRAAPDHIDNENMANAIASQKSILAEVAKPFGSIDRLHDALLPYYEKCNKDGRIDRSVAHDFKVYGANKPNRTNKPNEPNKSNEPNEPNEPTPTYDPKDYKRIWTYVSRQDVAHTEKRLRKMRECIDEAKAASMPNIEAMETFYQKEAELVLAEQQKRLDDGEPTLL